MLFGAPLIILILVLVFQIIRRFGGLFDSILARFDLLKLKLSNIWEVEPPKIIKSIFLFSVVLIFVLLFYNSYRQYQIWSHGQIAKFLLSPYNQTYFIFYVAFRFFLPYLISFSAGILFLLLSKYFNRKYENRFFCPEEPYMAALSIFLTGYPGWLIYLILLILTYLFLHFVSSVTPSRRGERIALYYLWIPVAIFVILIEKWLEILPLWGLLKI